MSKKYGMKKLFSLLIALVCISSISFSQEVNTDSLPIYKKNPTIPSFKILRPNNYWYTNDSLPANKSLVIIYFSPDCNHCQHEAKEIVNHIDSFGNTSFIWVSYHPLEEIDAFQQKFGLDKFQNIIVGRDPLYHIPSLYKVAFTPFIAIYNNKGIFVKEFREGASVDELLQALK